MIALAGINIETVDWSTFAPLANHLWQSTIFAGIAGLLTLLLRKNRAQARYWLWLIASAKFLIPFSLLIILGSHLEWSKPASITQPMFTFAMQEIGQPFSRSETYLQDEPATARPRTLPAQPVVILLTAVWVCGSLAVMLAWWLRWRRLVLAIRPALPANTGRELEVLRRLERARGTKPIDLFSSDAALEPGVVGIVRPVLLLPAGISDRLTDAQLEAIMAHELCHVRRHDNMIAVLHMVVEAMFWFHPLVWWVGSRLVDERERACDEEVLRMGCDPEVYAQGILKVCKFYLESPLVCVAGVTGSNLKKRIEEIMMHRIVHQLELKKKLLLAVAGTAAIVLPVAFGVLHALPLPALPLQPLKSLPVDSLAQSAAGQLESGSAVTLRRSKSLPVESLAQSAAGQFEPIGVLPPRPLKNPAQSPAGQPESGSVQPDKNGPTMPPFPPAKGSSFLRFTPDSLQATNAPLSMLIGLAYDVNEFQVSGPSWIYSAKLEVINVHFPKIEGRDPTEVMNQRRLWLQSFLARDVKLVVHRETKPAPIYELVVSASGPNFHEAAPGDTYANGVKQPWDGRPFGPGIWDAGAGEFVGQRVSMAGLAGFLSRQLGREVVDKTALTGNYDFTLHWAGEGAGKPAAILAAVPHDLGLQLDPQVAPVDMIIIDHAEQGSGSH